LTKICVICRCKWGHIFIWLNNYIHNNVCIANSSTKGSNLKHLCTAKHFIHSCTLWQAQYRPLLWKSLWDHRGHWQAGCKALLYLSWYRCSHWGRQQQGNCWAVLHL